MDAIPYWVLPLILCVGCLAAGVYIGVLLGTWYLRDAVSTGVLSWQGVRYRIDRIGRKPKE